MTIIEVVKPQTPQWKTSDYECTHQMEVFDTHFLWFGHVLLFQA